MNLEFLNTATAKELERFKSVCNQLFSRAYIVRTRYQPGKGRVDNPDYTFLSIHYGALQEYLSLLDWEVRRDDLNRYFYVQNTDEANRCNLNKKETAILLALRMIYDENQERLRKIDKFEAEKQDRTDQLSTTERNIQELADQIEQKDTRRKELELACAQSSVAQEEEKLNKQKQMLLAEQTKLLQELQNLALEIRRDTLNIQQFYNATLQRKTQEQLLAVMEAAEAAVTAFSQLQSGSYEIFSYPLSLFETAQEAAATLSDTIRTAAHKKD